jgi:D-glycero-D-manno-heptose 1,7-bisphosphate phosphatase
VFLDKDGTLIEDVPYNVDPERMRLTRGAQTALRRLGAARLPVVVVSNQSGVARGYFDESALVPVAERLRAFVTAEGATFLDFRYCPHLPGGVIAAYAVECDCRKPKPGLLVAAASAHALDLSTCWMVGDILDDIEAGRGAGCRTILLDNGHETKWRLTEQRIPDYSAGDLDEAAGIILGGAGGAAPQNSR